MKKLQIIPEIFEYTIEDAKNEFGQIILKAIQASHLAYAPYSNFKVGCALELDNGQIVLGGNQENAASPVCICAEGVALSSVSVLYPSQKINMVAVAVPQVQNPVSPCGICRQRFVEYEKRMNKTFQYLLVGKQKVYSFRGIEQILPLAFSELSDFNIDINY